MYDSEILHNQSQEEATEPCSQQKLDDAVEQPYSKLLKLAAQYCDGFTSKRILDVGCDMTGAVIRELTEKYGAIEAVGLNLALESQAFSEICRIEKGDICKTFYPDHYFDVILSISAFEHIQNFEVALQEMYRILKPGGTLYADFGPIWSTTYGHHLWLTYNDKTYNYWNVVLPPYCHLLMTEAEVLDWCLQQFDGELSQTITNYVFHSPDQNQLLFEEYETYVQNSQFKVEFFRGYQYSELGDRYQQAVSSEILEKLHQKFPLHQNFIYEGIEMALHKEVDNFSSFQQSASHHKILFFSPFGEWLVHNQVDAVLALKLRQQGGEVLIIGCDGLYQDCIITARANQYNVDPSVLCQVCSQSGKELFNSFNLPYVQFRKYVTDEDSEVAHQWIESIDPRDYATATYQELSIGKWVTSSVNSYFRLSMPQELMKPEVQVIHRQYLIDGVITYRAFSRLLDLYQPTNLIIFNSRLTPYRVAFEAARQRHIDVITHERGFIDDSFSFFDNTNCLSPKSAEVCVDDWKNIPLTTSELLEVSQYFKQREAGSGLNWKPFFDFQTNYKEVRQKLNIPADAKIFTLFTSSPDELAASDDYIGVTEQLKFVDQFIQIFTGRDEYLVIRHHPWIGGSAVHPANIDFLTLAYQQAQSAPKNVRIVMPNEQLTSYALLWNTDAAIAFFSTVAIEAAARGVCTASFELSPYRKAFNHLMKAVDLGQASLCELVDSLLAESASQHLEQAIERLRQLYRFTNAYFFRFSSRFRSFGIKNHYFYDLRFEQIEDLRPGLDPTLDRICDRITQKTSLYELPNRDRQHASSTEEDVFLQAELSEILKTRQIIQQQNQECSSPVHFPSVGVICLQYRDIPHNQNLTSVWIERSRHRQIQLYSCPITSAWENHVGTIDTILQTLNACQEPYLLITNPSIQYDESFLSSALELLKTEGKADLQGVLVGAWIADPDQQIKTSIFTPAHPFKDYEDAVQIAPLLQHPISLLGFVLLERRLLIKLLNVIRDISFLPSASESLFLLLKTPIIHKLEFPMMVIHSSSRQLIQQLILKRLKFEHEQQHLRQKYQQLHEEINQVPLQLQQAQSELEALRLKVEQQQLELERSQIDLEKEQRKLKRQRERLKVTRKDAEQLRNQIEAMHSSKFWKLRNVWLRLKQLITLQEKL
jgi:ubiquinone/menaquinone biosynthesis C-methylase UbiE